jgi:hypothetical protein
VTPDTSRNIQRKGVSPSTLAQLSLPVILNSVVVYGVLMGLKPWACVRKADPADRYGTIDTNSKVNATASAGGNAPHGSQATAMSMMDGIETPRAASPAPLPNKPSPEELPLIPGLVFDVD